MNFIGGVGGGDWNSDLLPQFLTNSWVSNEINGTANLQISSSPWPARSMNMMPFIDEALNMLPSIDEALFCSSETCSSNLRWGGHFLNANCLFRDSQSSIDLCFENLRSTYSYYQDGADLSLRPISESDILENKNLKSSESEKGLLEDPKKRHRIEENVSKTGDGRSKKKQKIVCSSRNNEKYGNGGKNGQSTSNCHSEDDSNASQESTPKSFSLIGKARAARGSATNQQSLYARKRRERINEKLRTLQNLVPSGTKVDISTMLEEAVHYVKFLQLQIKLLSSDEMWMYAPIAYNEMDLGLNTRQL